MIQTTFVFFPSLASLKLVPFLRAQSSSSPPSSLLLVRSPDPSLPPPLKYIDAHPVLLVPQSNFQAQVGGNLILPPTGKEEEEDPDVAAFLPMLREYLAGTFTLAAGCRPKNLLYSVEEFGRAGRRERESSRRVSSLPRSRSPFVTKQSPTPSPPPPPLLLNPLPPSQQQPHPSNTSTTSTTTPLPPTFSTLPPTKPPWSPARQ